jgi:hypothetical protein
MIWSTNRYFLDVDVRFGDGSVERSIDFTEIVMPEGKGRRRADVQSRRGYTGNGWKHEIHEHDKSSTNKTSSSIQSGASNGETIIKASKS